jgi:hypothetical protein
VAGFEPAVSGSRRRRISRLSHTLRNAPYKFQKPHRKHRGSRTHSDLSVTSFSGLRVCHSAKRFDCMLLPMGYGVVGEGRIPQSARRELNPRFQHGKLTGYRYITGALR